MLRGCTFWFTTEYTPSAQWATRIASFKFDSCGTTTTPTGACCNGTSCSVQTQAACASSGGTYKGDGTNCSSNPCTTSSGVTPVDIAAAPGQKMWLLFNNNGKAVVKRLTATGSVEATYSYGPFAGGWNPVAISVGPDGFLWLDWNNADSAAIWRVAQDGTVAGANLFGPFAGWSAPDISVGPNNYARLLFVNQAGGAVMGWLNANVQFVGYYDYTGVPLPWTARRLSADGSDATRVFWENASTREIVLWNVALNGAINPARLFGPYSGYAGVDVGAERGVPASATHFLIRGNDQSLVAWLLDGAFNVTAARLYGPYAGYSPVVIAGNDQARTLAVWKGPNGEAVVWVLDPGLGVERVFTVNP